MAIGVIHALEEVQVDHRHGHGQAQSAREHQFSVDSALEKAVCAAFKSFNMAYMLPMPSSSQKRVVASGAVANWR
jgi:hypothetical protein